MKGGDLMSVEIKNKPEFDENCRKPNHRERENEEICCVCRTVRFIDFIQKKAIDTCCINCESPRLGTNVPGVNAFNTRPFILYLCDGSRLEVVTDLTDPEETAFIFRVEEVRDCCAVLRALEVDTVPSPPGPPQPTIISTNFCVNVDLCKFCAIQCLGDTFVPCNPVQQQGPPGPPV